MSWPVVRPGLCCALGGLLFGLVTGCGGEVRAELLEVDGLSADVVTPGTRLTLSGRGLPALTDAELALDGTLHTATGARPLAIRLPAEIVTEDRAEVLVTGAQLDELVGQRGTFEGSATLAVAMAGAAGELTGTLDEVTLDLMPASDEPPSGEPLGERLGLTLEREDERSVVRAVDGAAARWGVLPGDVLVAIDGLRVQDEADLFGWTELPRELRVERAGGELTLGPRPSELDPDHTLRTLQLAVLLVVLALLLRARPTPLSRPPRKVLAGYLVLGVGLVLVHLALSLAGVDRFPELLAPASFVIVLTSGAAGLGREGLASLAGVALGLGRALLLLWVLAAVTLAAGLSELGELWASQSLSPFTWALLGSPLAPALLLLLSAAMPSDTPGARGRLFALAHELALVAVAAACLMGGPGPGGALGAAAFVARGLLLSMVLRTGARWLRSLDPRALAAAIGLGLVLATVPALATLNLLPDTVGEALAQAALGRAAAEVWVIALALGALVLLSARPPADDPELAL